MKNIDPIEAILWGCLAVVVLVLLVGVVAMVNDCGGNLDCWMTQRVVVVTSTGEKR